MNIYNFRKKKNNNNTEIILHKSIEKVPETISDDVSANNSFSLLLKKELINIVQIFRQHGCDIVASDTEIKMAYDTSWFSEYRIIRKDGIYLYREVAMGGYNLEKRLDCTDMSASFLILCADLLLGMKYRKMISTDEPDYHIICETMQSNKSYVLSIVADHNNFLVEGFINSVKTCSDKK